MFIGHFAVGFAAKKVAPRASLGVLMAALSQVAVAGIRYNINWPISNARPQSR